ncbi:MAG: hypothetical protein L3J58_11255 [Emcibacter sp.]|nr:hypothetical protein [Emcibacter sp.]
MKALIIFFISFCISQYSYAESEILEEVIVTGSSVSIEFDEEKIPAIKLLRRADSILLEVTVTNDSRKKEMRYEEIHQTLHDMIKKSAKYKNIVLGYGDGVFRPLDVGNYKDIILTENRNVNDTTNTTIFVKTSLEGQKGNSKKLIQDIKEFISNVQLAGRTELDRDNDPILTIINPEKYRYDLINKISEDAKKVSGSFGDDYRVTVEGLQQTLLWERASIDEMYLFILYRYQIVPLNSSVTTVSE